MNEQLQAEVPLFVPVVSGPTEVPLTPMVSLPHLPALFVPVSIPIVRGNSWNPSLREM